MIKILVAATLRLRNCFEFQFFTMLKAIFPPLMGGNKREGEHPLLTSPIQGRGICIRNIRSNLC